MQGGYKFHSLDQLFQNYYESFSKFAYLIHGIQIVQFIDAKENYRCMNCNRSVSISCFINFFLGFSGNFLLLSNFLAENFGRAQNLNGCFIFQNITLKIRLLVVIRFSIEDSSKKFGK